MPVSTEVLNDDIKQLKSEFHQLGIGLAELRQEVKDAIGLAKWAGTFAVATMLTSGVAAIIWGASLTAKVNGMDGRFDRLEASITRAIEQARAGGKGTP